VIPDACRLLTTEGIIETSSLNSDHIAPKIFIPPDDTWIKNPQFLAGEAGLASGLLVWLNIVLIEAHLCDLFGIKLPPIPSVLRELAEGNEILGDSTESNSIRLFGINVNRDRNTYGSRFERLDLPKDKVGETWTVALSVKNRLQQAWDKTSTLDG
jgi:hypothetical protein